MAYTQKERMARVTSPLGDDALLLAELTAHEALSSPYFFDLRLISEKDDLDFAALIGKPLGVTLELANGRKRHFHGIVSRFAQGPAQGRFASYRAEVVPWVALLRRRTNCKIHRGTVPDIIRSVLEVGALGDFSLPLGSYPEREYCVQYRETDLAFVSRLAEEEGIGFFFEHTEKAHKIVFFDSPSAHAPCPGQAQAAYNSAVDATAPGGSIAGWRIERELAAGKYAIKDYNFEDPGMDLLSSTTSAISLGGNERFEIYDYPGEYVQLSEGERRVKLRMQAEEAASVRARAQSDCPSFTPGYRFDLQGHFRGDYNAPYLITEVTHHVSQDVGDAGTPSFYSNEFAALPHSIPFRPLPRTPKPLITGVQTATVVGASGKEIDVDQYGRVVVQFHWDRVGVRDQNSSCRVRVSQGWAGKNWGMISNPRIGQEVIVEFIEGDPDRPIITGRVYNGEQTVPYALPGAETQTGIKTRSSMEGAAANFNEIRFEDKKGEEQLFIHAEKNMDSEVEKDQTLDVGNDRSSTIGNNETHHVKKDRTKKVDNDERVTIGQDQVIDVNRDRRDTVSRNEDRSVKEKRTRNVGKGETIHIGETQEITVDKDYKLGVKENHRTTVEKDLSLSVGKNAGLDVTEGYSLDAKTVTLDAGDEITIKTGDASISMKKNGDITIKGGKITIDGSGDVIVKGKNVKIN